MRQNERTGRRVQAMSEQTKARANLLQLLAKRLVRDYLAERQDHKSKPYERPLDRTGTDR